MPSAVVRRCEVSCGRCGAAIAFDVIMVKPDRTESWRQPLNELLVDCGWLPTTRGYYCRVHRAVVLTTPRR